jgi:hypothetical protein
LNRVQYLVLCNGGLTDTQDPVGATGSWTDMFRIFGLKVPTLSNTIEPGHGEEKTQPHLRNNIFVIENVFWRQHNVISLQKGSYGVAVVDLDPALLSYPGLYALRQVDRHFWKFAEI